MRFHIFKPVKSKTAILTSFFVLLFAAVLFSQTGSFQFDGVSRDYLLHEPSGYDGTTPLPLVINMHGFGSNASQQQFYSNMNPVADNENFFVVYPNGVSNAWNVGFQGQDYINGVDDVGFINALIDTLMTNYAIDPTRIYSTGMSNGGFMSYRLACDLHNRIAAIASVTGSMTTAMATYCINPPPFPILEIHGTEDPTVPYGGLGVFVNIDTVIKFWVNNNQCIDQAEITNLPDVVTTDGATITQYSWSNCDGSSRVMLLKVIDGGHTWPGAPLTIGVTCMDINGSQAIWDFFNQTPISAQSHDESYENGFYSIRIINNPAVKFLELEYVSATGGQLKILDVHGKTVFQQYTPTTFAFGKTRIDTQHLRAGFYLLNFQTDHTAETLKFVKH